MVETVRRLKEEPGLQISADGVKPPAALAAEGLVGQFTFVVHPVIAGRAPRLLDGIRDQSYLELVEQPSFRLVATVRRFRPIA